MEPDRVNELYRIHELVLETLYQDIVQLRSSCEQSSSSIKRRALFRAILSHMEAKANAVAILARHADEWGLLNLTDSDRSALGITKQGRIRGPDLYTRMINTIEFEARDAIWEGGHETPWKLTLVERDKLRGAIQRRNHLMHPERPEDIEIRNSDLQIAFEAFNILEEKLKAATLASIEGAKSRYSKEHGQEAVQNADECARLNAKELRRVFKEARLMECEGLEVEFVQEDPK